MEQRHARQLREAEEREQVEQERRELEVLELEVAEGLLMMNMPTCVATQTEAKPTLDSCQQTETLVQMYRHKRKLLGTWSWNLLKLIRQPMQLVQYP